MINCQGDWKKFSVVQFIARPFKEIDDYVCVPDNWVVIRRHQDQKIVVSYPRDEEKSVTRERVKREEQYDDDWKFWIAEQKYQADTFEDADLWITTSKDHVPLPSQNLSVNATQSTSASNKVLRSNKQKSTSDSKEDRSEMIAKPHKIARKPLPRVTIKRLTSDDVQPEHKTKRGRKPTTKAVEPTDAGARSANAEPECSRRSASFENEPEVITIMDGGCHSQQDRKEIKLEIKLNLQGNRKRVETTPNAAQNSRVVSQSVPSVISARQNLSSSSQQRPNFDRQSTSRQELLQRTHGESRPDPRLQIPRPVPYLNPLDGTERLDEHIEALYQIQRLMNGRRSNLLEGRKWRPAPATTSPRSRRPPPPPQEATRESSSPLFLSLPNYVQRTLLATRGNLLSDEERTRGNEGQGVRVNRPAPIQMTCYKNSDMKSKVILPTYKKKRFYSNQSSLAADSGIELDNEALREVEAEDALLPPPEIVTHDLDDDLEFVPVERMMDHGAAATDQISSTLNSIMVNTFENLRTVIHEATATYYTLLENMQRINSSENSASQASTSRDSAIFVSASSNGYQDRNHMEVVQEVNPNPPLQITLPPEYDPTDTAWTLKHEEDEPGLQELVPYTRVYIKFGELKFWEQISEDCPTLARRILRELFKRNALSVCASMTEKEPNGRPKLNEHACAVLIDYVIGQGVKRRWNTDMQPILEALDDEVKKIRSKSGGRFTRQVVQLL